MTMIQIASQSEVPARTWSSSATTVLCCTNLTAIQIKSSAPMS